MADKIIEFGTNVHSKFLTAVEKTADFVAATMGPKGKNIVMSQGRSTKVTKDGISVIRYLDYSDPLENTALCLLREASEKTNSVGDGTTGTCVLAASIFKEGVKTLNFGANGIHLRNGIQKAAEIVVESVKKQAVKIDNNNDLFRVAKISSNHSDEIANALVEVFSKIGENGTIKVEPGNRKIETRVVEGMQFQNGYSNPYFVNRDNMTCELDNAYVFIIDKKISNISEILKPIQAITKEKRAVLIIAEEVDGDAISTLVLNKVRGTLNVCVVQSPSYGQNRKNILFDIAILTGGQVVSEDTGIIPDEAVPSSGYLGTAKKIIVSKDSTTIIEGLGSKEKIQERIEQLKTQIEQTEDEFDKKKMKERLAKLDGGVGIVSVGANTEAEIKERLDLVDDAFSACKAALVDGVVAGGGAALLFARKDLDKYLKENQGNLNDDEVFGFKILSKALDAPIQRIVGNAGESPDVVVKKILDEDKEQFGYDVLTKTFGNMFELGIIDPTQVIVAEIENAASIASLLLTTAGAIAEKPELQPQLNNQ